MNYLVERTTDIVAAGAVASPWWLPGLVGVSDLATLLLPIAGLVWLGVQIYVRLTRGK